MPGFPGSNIGFLVLRILVKHGFPSGCNTHMFLVHVFGEVHKVERDKDVTF